MPAVSFLVSLLLCYLVQAHSLGEGKNPNQHHCRPSFNCSKLGNLGFPFTSQACPQPDLLTLSDCDKDAPTIQLQKPGRRYEVEAISQSDIIHINDTTLRQSLSSESCQYFEDLALPSNATFLSFHVVGRLLRMLKCDSHVPFGSNLLHANCSAYGYGVYYSHDQHNGSTSPPPDCSIIHLPAARKGNNSSLFSLLSAEFSLQVEIHPECGFCRHIEGECEQDIKGSFHCAKGNGKSGLKLGLALGLGIGWTLIVAIYLLWYIRRRREKHKSASSRNCSSHYSSRADLEEGSIQNGVYIFSYSELEEATNHFKESNEIGDGRLGPAYYGYGIVINPFSYLDLGFPILIPKDNQTHARSWISGKLQDGREVAVKRLCVYNNRRLEQFMIETEILTRLRHRNLISLYGCTSGCSRELLLVYEFIPNGTLAYHLRGEGSKTGCSLTWPIRMSIAIQTASALAYLHASHTMHGDLKTDNILLDNNLCVKVSGFELSRLFPIDVTHASTAPLGTPGYVDPEYFKCFQLTHKSDVYSFGVVLMELISSLPAFDTRRHRDELSLANLAINKVREGTFNKLVDPSLGFGKYGRTRDMILSIAELACRCLQQDKDMRPDMAEVKENLNIIRSGEGKSVISLCADKLSFDFPLSIGQ